MKGDGNRRAPRRIGTVNFWRCIGCGEYLPREGFHASTRHCNGLNSRCKRCKVKENAKRSHRLPRFEVLDYFSQK